MWNVLLNGRDSKLRANGTGRPKWQVAVTRDYCEVVRLHVSLTAVYEPVENGWTQARIEELPAVITAAPTLEEAKGLLLDALREYLLSLGEDAEPLTLRPASPREPLEIVLGA